MPFSYQVTGGLTALGCLLRRNKWIDQVDWKVYPNQSVLFIGPSGVGKDTIINRVQKVVDHFHWLTKVPTLGGTTFENLQERLARLSKPACAYLPAAEMTKFFGKADYQANMLTGITDLLSTGEKIDITTKGQLTYTDSHGNKIEREARFIYEPTITMHAGSTVEWLHKHMPEGTLEGGFLGRFLIVVEELGSTRQQPLLKSSRDKREIKQLEARMKEWYEGLEKIINSRPHQNEVVILNEAEDVYNNWYRNRFDLFSKAVLPYANRSRDTVLRLAMLMAFSRNHIRYIEAEDMEFAVTLMKDVAEKIDKVVIPPTEEAKIAMAILEMLPATGMEIYSTLSFRYKGRNVQDALETLTHRSNLIYYDATSGMYHKRGDLPNA